MDVNFDTVVMVDWSGGNAKGPKPCADAIWASVARHCGQDLPQYFASRQALEPWLSALIDTELTAGRRIMIGFDFAFGYPADAAERITGSADALALWDWFEQRIEDTPAQNNRFDVAADINARFDGIGPFWGNGLQRDIAHLPRKGRTRTTTGFVEKRIVEQRAAGAFSVWQLSGAGAVGSQVLMGLPVLSRLRKRYASRVAVWPFEVLDAPVALVEIWPSLYKKTIADGPYDHWITDAAQVHVTADIIRMMPQDQLARALDVPATREGWIFGVAP